MVGLYASDGSLNVTLAGQSGSTISWTMPALVATSAGAATDVLAAGLATRRLIIVNESATDAVRIRFDGGNASSVLGLSLAPGKGLAFGAGEVPTGKISAYSTNSVNLAIAYA